MACFTAPLAGAIVATAVKSAPSAVRPLLGGKPSNRVLAAHAHRGAELVEKCALVFLVRQLTVSPSRQENVVFFSSFVMSMPSIFGDAIYDAT